MGEEPDKKADERVMEKIVADSTFLIDVLRGEKGAEAFLDRVIVTTPLSLFEIIKGLHAGDTSGEQYEKVIALFNTITMLPLTELSMLRAGKIAGELLRSGNRISDVDCLIAGVALSNNCNIVLTRNKEHFNRIPGITVKTY